MNHLLSIGPINHACAQTTRISYNESASLDATFAVDLAREFVQRLATEVVRDPGRKQFFVCGDDDKVIKSLVRCCP
jgi:hypothetical protein